MQDIFGSVLKSLAGGGAASTSIADRIGSRLQRFGAAIADRIGSRLRRFGAAIADRIVSRLRRSRAALGLGLEPRPKPPSPAAAPPIRWRRGELIGSGGFGDVYMGMNLDSGELLAVKQVWTGTSDASRERAKSRIRELEEEVKLLKNLSHPNIVFEHSID